jgi:decaprenylphospho-beta-D-ribofuranose 2-oxidase
MKKIVENWGLYPKIEADWIESTATKTLNKNPIIARGLGRSYGDSASQIHIFSTLKLNKILAFNPSNGLLTCQAGTSFDKILKTFVPKGWFLPVTPGTKFITVGGAIASDIHGKNHHVAGTFCRHVQNFTLLSFDGTIHVCSKSENPELFALTCGGMGLSGIILQATFSLIKIPSAYIAQKSFKARNLSHIMDLFHEHHNFTNSVAWIDCLSSGKNMGRSILMAGEFCEPNELPIKKKSNPFITHKKPSLSVPFYFPSFALNPLTVKAFNQLYYHKQNKQESHNIVHYETFFYPLDAIYHWNRIYGKNGFTQYQFVLPTENATEGLHDILSFVAKQKWGSFLSVLKLFGPENENYLRFPKPGFTLTLDFKITPKLFPFLNELDARVAQYNGRVYLTKDVRMSPEFFLNSYPQAQAFIKKINQINPNGFFSSLQSQRLAIHS